MEFSRRDLGYTIISRFEEAFRSAISAHLVAEYENFLDGVPSGVVSKASDRSSVLLWSHPDELLEQIDFPDLMEIITYNNSFRKYFAGEIKQDEFQAVFDELYSLRCKIAHVHQAFTIIDMDKLIEDTKLLTPYIGLPGRQFLNFVDELVNNPADLVLKIPNEFFCENQASSRIPNNVPTPDYEYEGGFVGRDDDIRKILSLVEGDLHRVITISGAGGVGKTALALRVVYKILERSKIKFDGVIWLSAKETKLSYLGIEDIEPTVKTYEQLLDTISEVMGFEADGDDIQAKEEHVRIIFDLYQSILVVIDNLETITDDNILNFILDAHPKIKVLITSRRGLGQVERRYELKQLKEKEAVYLFRAVARDKKLESLAGLGDETIRGYVKRVACYPLAIKWVIGNVAIGKDINDVVRAINETTSDISRFCFEQIFGALSENAKKVLCTLSVFDQAPSAGVLNYVLDFDQQTLEDAIGELIMTYAVEPPR